MKRKKGGKKKGNDTSLRDLRLTSGGSASGQETKLVHATRARVGTRNCGFHRVKKSRGFLLHWFSFHLRVINDRMVQSKP